MSQFRSTPVARDPEAVQIATVYIATFAPRTDAYARPSEPRWVAVREPLTPELIISCFVEGRPGSLSAYMLAPDSTSHVMAIDFDTDTDGLDLARGVQRVMARAGLPAYVEPSRPGRAHLWCVLGEVLPGIVLRRALQTFLADADIAPSPKIELRPGHDHLAGDDSLGIAMRMPTMPHRLTGERRPLFDADGTSLGLKLAPMLLAIDLAPTAPVLAAAERHADLPVVVVRGPSRSGPSPIARFNASVGVSAVLAREWGVERVQPGRTIRCPAHDDRNASLSIARDDSRAWCHAPDCLLHGPDGAGHDAYGLAALARSQVAS